MIVGARLNPQDAATTARRTIVVVAIAVAAWLATLAGHGAGHGLGDAHVGSHPLYDYCTTTGSAMAAGAGPFLWLGGWTIMVVAMMLPPALPFLGTMQQLVAHRREGGPLLVVTASAFLASWVLAGMALLAGGELFSMVVDRIDALSARPSLSAGAAALLAAGYQFTPLKRACLAACRSPRSLVLTRWRGEAPWRAATTIGWRYGAICIGCCWALMLLSVVVGTLALPVMVVTASFMAAERLLPSARPLIAAQAVFAAALGVLLILGVVAPAQVLP
jgi:predicted metal-binding membrane protein